MAINVSQAFHRTSANPVDDTMALNKAEMLTVNDNLMPSKYLTVCQDDGFIYLYDKTNTADPESGKFRKFEGGSSETIQVTEMPTANAELADKILQYVGTTTATYTNGFFYKCVSDGQGYSWANQTVQEENSSGHIIVDSSDTELTQRDTLKFGDGFVAEDDSTDEQTVITPSVLESGDMEDIVFPLPTQPHPDTSCGYTPVGTVISVMGNEAPLHYLACNGQIVSIASYPELANYFEEQFGSKNKFGGDGTTTFAVPNLSGEFLRGTGTNSHANQGNGAAVGVHQNGTEHIRIGSIGTNTSADAAGIRVYANDSNTYGQNFDSSKKGTHYKNIRQSTVTTAAEDSFYTSRPTNTSVLYCIATKDIYINPFLDYSTSEKVVGRWIDGKPLYQKTIVDTLPQTATDYSRVQKYISLGVSIDYGHIVSAITIDGSNNIISLPYHRDNGQNQITEIFMFIENTNHATKPNAIRLNNNIALFSNMPIYITIQYTKTT